MASHAAAAATMPLSTSYTLAGIGSKEVNHQARFWQPLTQPN